MFAPAGAMGERITVYVEVLGEGVDVWRPVSAVAEPDGSYRLIDEQPADEHWAFPPGSRVRCEPHRLSGHVVQVVSGLAA